jgi:Tol biopolymer transport system component
MQNLVLFRPEDGTLVSLGRFYQEQPTDQEWRCDLHPRWSRDGRSVCIDSKCSGQRQMYLLDVSGIILPSE